MNKEAKEFRSKYFYAPRRTTLPKRTTLTEDFDQSVENLIDIKSSFEASAEPKVIGKEKTVEERLQDIKPYIEEDIDL